jgi:hypothetical protein
MAYSNGVNDFTSTESGGVHTPHVQLAAVATAEGAALAKPITSVMNTKNEVKASAGVLYGFYLYNSATSKRYIRFYDATVAGTTVGTTAHVIGPITLEADQGVVITLPVPVYFSTAITTAATTGVADNNTGATTANDVQMTAFYK